jgi:hypothetical protein
MKNMIVTCENIVNTVPEVIKWNQWDFEHLKSVHSAYENPKILVSNKETIVFIDNFKIPLIGIRLKSLVYSTQWSDKIQITFTQTILFLAKNTIELTQLGEKKTKVKVTYELTGNIFQSLLFPIYKILLQKWNSNVWIEDLPLKLRRQKALEYGFQDFKGLPSNIDERKDISSTYKCDLPVPRVKNIIETNHIYYINK